MYKPELKPRWTSSSHHKREHSSHVSPSNHPVNPPSNRVKEEQKTNRANGRPRPAIRVGVSRNHAKAKVHVKNQVVKPLLTKVKRERRKFECKGCKETRVWVASVSNRHTRKRREREVNAVRCMKMRLQTLYERRSMLEISSCSYCRSREAQWGCSCAAAVGVQIQAYNCAVGGQVQRECSCEEDLEPSLTAGLALLHCVVVAGAALSHSCFGWGKAGRLHDAG
jgi:hypothetical protein